MAQTQIKAIESRALVRIEISCLEAQTALAIAGLTSEGAKQFVEKLPTVEALMPTLSLSEIAGEADPPVAELRSRSVSMWTCSRLPRCALVA